MKCPLCLQDNHRTFKAYRQEAGAKTKFSLCSCNDCGLIYAEDYLRDRSAIYDKNYSPWGESEEYDEEAIAQAKRESFRHQISVLSKFINPTSQKLLDFGTGKGYLLDVATTMGFDCYGNELSAYAAQRAAEKFPGRICQGSFLDAQYQDNQFDVITMTDFLEHIPDPHILFHELSRVLKPGGLIFVITPNTGSLTRKILGKHWFQYKDEHVTYWDKRSLERLLQTFGFRALVTKGNKKRFSLGYYYHYLQKYSLFGVGKLFQLFYRLLPKSMRGFSFTNPLTGELLLVAQSQKSPQRQPKALGSNVYKAI